MKKWVRDKKQWGVHKARLAKRKNSKYVSLTCREERELEEMFHELWVNRDWTEVFG